MTEVFESLSAEKSQPAPTARPKRRAKAAPDEVGEQLQIDGTGEIARPTPSETANHADDADAGRWQPAFDVDDNLDGLLEVRSPLLARAFRGTGRPRS